MMSSALRILSLMTMILTLLFAPIALEINLGGKAHAGGGGSGKGGGKKFSPGPTAKKYSFTDQEETSPAKGLAPEGPTTPVPTPEPATWLLLGAGAAGLAAFKKFKKKK